VAILVGLDDSRAVIWQVFSSVVKPYATVRLEGTRRDAKALYRFHEAIVKSLRPLISEGIKSIVLATPMKTDLASAFLNHIHKHDVWLSQEKGQSSASFGELFGSAIELQEVADLVKKKAFTDLINRTTSTDADRTLERLDKQLSNLGDVSGILYSLEEVESLVYKSLPSTIRPEYLILTNQYLSNHRNRLNKLLQISRNRKIRTLIVDQDTPAGKRLKQFGGLVCLTGPVEVQDGR